MKININLKKILFLIAIILLPTLFFYKYFWFNIKTSINEVKINNNLTSDLHVILDSFDKQLKQFNKITNIKHLCKQINCTIDEKSKDEYIIKINYEIMGKLINFTGNLKKNIFKDHVQFNLDGFINAPYSNSFSKLEKLKGTVNIKKTENQTNIGISVKSKIECDYIKIVQNYNYLKNIFLPTLETLQTTFYQKIVEDT